jgi:hypothetical protein
MNPLIISWTHRSRELTSRGSNFIGLSKQGSSCTKASGSPGPNSTEISSSDGGNSMQWRPFLPKGGGLIQVDIGGHPPIPTGSNQFFDNLLFLASFLGPKLSGPF